MFSLRAGFKALQAVVDAILQPLVIAGFKMQAMKIMTATPVAAIQRVTATSIKGTGYILILMFC